MDTDLTRPLDLDAYLGRTGYNGPRTPTPAALAGLHLAHTTRIPFENLDILLGRGIRVDLESIQAKLVRARRGGYCFEQNTLFGEALRCLGFGVTMLAARVRFRATRLLPRTHVLLLVEAVGRRWIADVGFGSAGLLEPIPLVANEPVRQSAWTYRLIEEPGLWLLQLARGEAWQDLYSFSLEPQFPPDVEMMNHYVSTHPDSRFVQTLIAQRSTAEARYILRNHEFIVDRGTEVQTRMLSDEAEVLRALGEWFDLTFEPGTRFRIPTTGEPLPREAGG